jgi:hypothetical protein
MKKPNLSIDVSIANAQADQQTDSPGTQRHEAGMQTDKNIGKQASI